MYIFTLPVTSKQSHVDTVTSCTYCTYHISWVEYELLNSNDMDPDVVHLPARDNSHCLGGCVNDLSTSNFYIHHDHHFTFLSTLMFSHHHPSSNHYTALEILYLSSTEQFKLVTFQFKQLDSQKTFCPSNSEFQDTCR